MHRAMQVLEAIHAALEPLESQGVKEVRFNSLEPIEDYPTVVIRMGQDTPLETGNSFFQDWDLTVSTDIYVNSTNPNLDAKTLSIRTMIHKALMTNRHLGLQFVFDTKPLGQLQPDYDGDAEDYAGATRLNWEVRYRSSFTDPEN